MRLVIGALIVFLLTPAWARGEDLVLVDGRYLQVKLLGATEKALHVHVLETGGKLWIPWPLIAERDRNRLMILYGYKEEDRAQITVEGVQLITKQGDIYVGVPKEPFDDQSLPDEVIIIHRGSELPFRKDVIRSITRTDVPVLDAYTREQYYKMQLDERKPAEDDLAAQWDMAHLCVDLQDFEHAIVHLLKVRRLDQAYREDYVSNQLTRLEALAKDQRTVDAINDARRDAFVKRFDQAIQKLDQIIAIPDLNPNLKADAEIKKTWVVKARWSHYTKEVTRHYLHLLNRKVGDIAADPKMKLRDAQNVVRRDLHKAIIADLASRFGLDPKKEVEKMWEERVLNQPRVDWYGSGSFIILGKAEAAERLNQQLQRQMAQAAQQARQSQGARGETGSFTPPMTIPKPPTRDEWWEKQADTGTRASWLKAYFAENSKSVTVVGERVEPCPRCGATGSIKLSGAQGETFPVVCPRCQGHRRDKGVAYK
jgi:hypothetical protein